MKSKLFTLVTCVLLLAGCSQQSDSQTPATPTEAPRATTRPTTRPGQADNPSDDQFESKEIVWTAKACGIMSVEQTRAIFKIDPNTKIATDDFSDSLSSTCNYKWNNSNSYNRITAYYIGAQNLQAEFDKKVKSAAAEAGEQGKDVELDNQAKWFDKTNTLIWRTERNLFALQTRNSQDRATNLIFSQQVAGTILGKLQADASAE